MPDYRRARITYIVLRTIPIPEERNMGDLLDFIPGGPWLLGAVALLAVPGVRKSLRPLAKSTMKLGIAVTDQVKGLTAETREQINDLYEEARSEYADARTDGAEATGNSGRPAGARARRSEAAEATP
jgi:hypothetical protein